MECFCVTYIFQYREFFGDEHDSSLLRSSRVVNRMWAVLMLVIRSLLTFRIILDHSFPLLADYSMESCPLLLRNGSIVFLGPSCVKEIQSRFSSSEEGSYISPNIL